jgi:hypothetical protein
MATAQHFSPRPSTQHHYCQRPSPNNPLIMTEGTKAPEETKSKVSAAVPTEPPNAEEFANAEKPPKAEESPNVEEPAPEAPKSELPLELKTVHSSPAPRDAPIPQEDDSPKDEREREKLLDDAIIFLETGTVRDAPVKEKQEFLQAKGLTATEAQELIGKVNGNKKLDRGKKTARRSEVGL